MYALIIYRIHTYKLIKMLAGVLKSCFERKLIYFRNIMVDILADQGTSNKSLQNMHERIMRNIMFYFVFLLGTCMHDEKKDILKMNDQC